MGRAQVKTTRADEQAAKRPTSLRAEQVEATRRAILTSARHLFATRGYSATAIDDIAREARVTKGAVYHHFDTKEALFRSVYDQVEGEAQARTASAADPQASPIDQLVQGMHGYLEATLDADVQRITLLDGPAVLGLEPDGPPDEQPGFVAMRSFIADAIRSGAIKNLDAGALAHLISGACLQAGFLIARSPDPIGARKRVGTVVEAMIRGL